MLGFTLISFTPQATLLTIHIIQITERQRLSNTPKAKTRVIRAAVSQIKGFVDPKSVFFPL